jgi:hypothetical protein
VTRIGEHPRVAVEHGTDPVPGRGFRHDRVHDLRVRLPPGLVRRIEAVERPGARVQRLDLQRGDAIGGQVEDAVRPLDRPTRLRGEVRGDVDARPDDVERAR